MTIRYRTVNTPESCVSWILKRSIVIPMNDRTLACLLLNDIVNQQRTLTQAFDSLKKAHSLSSTQLGFIYALSAGVLRWYPRLHYLAHQLLEKPLPPKDNNILLLILIGLDQLSYMRVPPHAAISETVEAARKLKKPWAVGLVNAILRRYQRQESDCLKKCETDQNAKTAHPDWLLSLLQTAYPTQWEAITDANNQEPPLALRVNLKKISRLHYLEALHAQAITAIPIPHTETGIIIQEFTEVTGLPGFQEGQFSVQDGAAQFVPMLLDLAPHQHILDACAAPGGKTTHLLEQGIEHLRVTALEISPHRAQKIHENLNRLGLEAKVIIGDASAPKTWWTGEPFDRILLDAPCSATGIIRRHPDIKVLRNVSDLSRLAIQQVELLNALWPLLKPKGILLYVTCSIAPMENSEVIHRFLENHQDAQMLPCILPVGISQPLGHQLIPGEHNMDGFYYARLVKL